MYSGEVQPYLDRYYSTLEKSKMTDLIQYATNNGKCIRGFIVKHIIEHLTGKQGDKIPWHPIACVELIHSASIIVDDLPCMDNDMYRRGKLSTFKQFGTNEAILSSYFIISQTLLIIIDGIEEINMLEENIDKKINEIDTKRKDGMSDKDLKTEGLKDVKRLQSFIKEWCQLLGKNLVMGQFLDLKCDTEAYFNIKVSETETINDQIIRYKTCSLFSFAFILGAIFSGKSEPETMDDFKEMGYHFGVMFQLMDDYHDKETDVPYTNYVVSKGLEKTIQKYKESRATFSLLLQKYNLYTDKFINLIANIDKLFVSF